MKAYRLLFILLLLGCRQMTAQEEIKIVNPSFESVPTAGRKDVPFYLNGWVDCGPTGQTPPDIQPNAGFDVTKPAYDGNTYLGFVTRADDTYESVSQKLEKNIQAGKCYEFSIALCRSEVYFSTSKITNNKEQFTNAVKLRVWGGNSVCDRAELLAESPLIMDSNWKEYTLGMIPRGTYKYLLFEAYYKTPKEYAYNGNLLLDKLSNIRVNPCPKDPVIADKGKDKKVNVGPQKPPVKDDKKTDAKPNNNTNPTVEDVFAKTIKAEELKVGQTLRIENLEFDIDSDKIKPESNKVLDELFVFLKSNQGLQVEIGGHTSGLCSDEYCNQLSKKRAKAVYQYLVNKGIPSVRLKNFGYGKTIPISTNDTPEGRTKNQRVEIKILENK